MPPPAPQSSLGDSPQDTLTLLSVRFHRLQVLNWVLSYDGVHGPEPMAICAASAAVTLSSVPIERPVAGVQVGLVDGKYIINPTRYARYLLRTWARLPHLFLTRCTLPPDCDRRLSQVRAGQLDP